MASFQVKSSPHEADTDSSAGFDLIHQRTVCCVRAYVHVCACLHVCVCISGNQWIDQIRECKWLKTKVKKERSIFHKLS